MTSPSSSGALAWSNFYVASTPQAMRYRVAQSILRGAKDKPAKPRIKREDTLRDVEIAGRPERRLYGA